MRDGRFTVGPLYDGVVDDGGAFDFVVVRDYIAFVLKSAGRHKLLFTACFLIVAAGAAALARVVPSRYRVDATLLVQQGSAMGALTNASLNRDWDVPIATQLVRRDNLVALARKTDFVRRHLAQRSPLSRARSWMASLLQTAPPTEDEQLRSTVDGIEHRLTVMPRGDGTYVITFFWSDPGLAYDYVQALLKAFLEERHEAITTQVKETVALLQARDADVQRQALDLAAQLDQKEKSMRGRGMPRRTAPLALPATPDDEVAQLETRLAARRQALAELEEMRRRRLDDAQARYTELLHVFAPEHPQVIQMQRDIESLSGPSAQTDQLRSEVRDLQASLKRVAPARTVAPPVLIQSSPDFSDLGSLEDHRLDYERTQLGGLLRQHTSLTERIENARMELITAEADFKYRYAVVSPPEMPPGPLKPYALIVVVAGVLGGIAFAFFAATIADLVRGRVLERWQVERSVGLTVIGEVER